MQKSVSVYVHRDVYLTQMVEYTNTYIANVCIFNINDGMYKYAHLTDCFLIS